MPRGRKTAVGCSRILDLRKLVMEIPDVKGFISGLIIDRVVDVALGYRDM